MQLAPLIVFSGISILFTILQTNVLSFMSFQNVVPDISYIVIVFYAFHFGVMHGQVAGFTTGMVLDFVSLSPFGFNSFVRTVCTHIVGRFKGVVLLDAIFLPMTLISAALILKAIVSLLIGGILGIPSIFTRLFSLQFVVELLYTILVTPAVFWPLRALHSVIRSRRNYR